MINIYTDAYVRSHGCEPRGHGSWGFTVEARDYTFFAPAMSYSSAKVWAKAHARMKYGRHVDLQVAP